MEHVIEQGTEEWKALRLGKVTASRIADVMARTKSGYGAARSNYMAQLVVERMVGEPADFFTTNAMLWGIETEPEARANYSFQYDLEVVEIGFMDHPEIEMSGASPDGLVGADGLLEIKCPQTNTHIETLLTEKVPDKYVLQMLWQMACTGREWCDFVSFDPRMPPALQMFCRRVERDDNRIKEIEQEVQKFLAELREKINRLEQMAA